MLKYILLNFKRLLCELTYLQTILQKTIFSMTKSTVEFYVAFKNIRSRKVLKQIDKNNFQESVHFTLIN